MLYSTMAKHVLVLSLIALATLFVSCKGQSCTERFMELSLLTHRAGQISDIPDAQTPILEASYLDDEIRVLRDIAFTCPTTINSILLGANVQSVQDTRDQYPSIILVREVVRGTIVILAERTIYYNSENVSTNGVYNYSLNPPIEANIGDMLGIIAPRNNATAFTIHYTTSTYDTTSESIRNSLTTLISNQLVLAYPLTDNQGCVSVRNNTINADILAEESLNINSVVSQNNQYLYPQLQFSCNGSITKWIFGATEQIDQPFLLQPELQIWRQTRSGTYIKQGFSSVTANETASPNVHEYYPETALEFQEGDVLGIFYPSTENSNPLLYGQEGNGPINLVPSVSSQTIVAQLTSRDNNNFPLVLPVVAVNNDLQQSVVESSLPSIAVPSESMANMVVLTTISKPMPRYVIAIIVITATAIVLILTVVIVSVLVGLMMHLRRKSKLHKTKANKQPLPKIGLFNILHTESSEAQLAVPINTSQNYSINTTASNADITIGTITASPDAKLNAKPNALELSTTPPHGAIAIPISDRHISLQYDYITIPPMDNIYDTVNEYDTPAATQQDNEFSLYSNPAYARTGNAPSLQATIEPSHDYINAKPSKEASTEE